MAGVGTASYSGGDTIGGGPLAAYIRIIRLSFPFDNSFDGFVWMYPFIVIKIIIDSLVQIGSVPGIEFTQKPLAFN